MTTLGIGPLTIEFYPWWAWRVLLRRWSFYRRRTPGCIRVLGVLGVELEWAYP